MTIPNRQMALGLLVGLALSGGFVSAALAAGSGVVHVAPGRVIGTFVMRGRITAAVNVRGERPGENVTRRWVFAGLQCAHSTCRRLALRRERSAGLYSSLILTRVGTSRYAGDSSFVSALECKGRVYPRGELVPYRITVRVMQSVTIQQVDFAVKLATTYTNLKRTDRTPCPLGSSHDAARYRGFVTSPPSPPSASFAVSLSAGSEQAAFADTSALGQGGAPVVAETWQFGDPASGGADFAAGARPVHVFSAPGVYAVTLEVTDANGLTSRATQTVTVTAQAASPTRSVARTPASSATSRSGRVRTGATTQ
jgi:hypothetical protein